MLFPDNTVLINFTLVGHLLILGKIAPQCAWCASVESECLQSARMPGLGDLVNAEEFLGKAIIPTPAERQTALAIQRRMLAPADLSTKHMGESETIAIVDARNYHALFVTDDSTARDEAAAYGIRTATTWALLRHAIRAGLLTEDAVIKACIELRDTHLRGWPPCGHTVSELQTWLRSR